MTQSVQVTHLTLVPLLLVQLARNVHAKGLVGKLPGNPASCQEEPCNSDPQHVLAALKVMCMFLACVFILPLILYYLSKMFTKIRGVCCPGRDESGEKGPQDCDDNDDDGDDHNVKQVKQQKRERTASSQANNNLCGSIAIISNGGKDQSQFQLNKGDDDDDHRKSSESNQNVVGDAARQEQLQQLITSRHQSLVQYGASPAADNSGSQQFGRNQAQRESQRAARRQQQQRNSIARMPGEKRSSSRPTPPPLCENMDGADIDAREEAAMMEAYTRMHPHRYSMYFGSGGASGLGGCAVGVATPASLLSNHNHSQNRDQRAIDHRLRPNKSMRGSAGGGGGGATIAARHQLARVTNPMGTSSIKRKKGVVAASGSYKIHPVRDDGAATSECTNNKQPLARADAIDDQQAHYCSPTALSHRQQQQQLLASSDQQNNNNNNSDNNNNQHHHQRLRAGQSSPYAGGVGGGGGGNFPFTGPDRTNNNWTMGIEATANLEVPSARPEHRHSIDGSILNNMLGSSGNTPATTTAAAQRLTPMDIKTMMTTRQQQQQQPSPISQNRERPEPFELRGQQRQLEYQQQQQVSALPNGHIDNQQHQQHQHTYQGRETNNGAGQLRPGGAVDARNIRRASLNAAALMCSPSNGRGQFY